MKHEKFLIGFFILLMQSFPVTLKGQSPCEFKVGADLVSSYIWRGSFLSGTSIQPAMGLKLGSFAIGAWGSVDIAGNDHKEIDLLVSYSLRGFMIGFSDYWMSGEGAYDYFNFKKDESPHELELNIAYTLSSIPLTFSWNTIFTGVGNKYLTDDQEMKNAYSTYIETAYAFPVKSVNLDVAVGASPWKSNVTYTNSYPYATDGFAIVNMSLKATRDIKITDNYSLSIFGQLIFNPAKEDAFFVFGISL